MNRKRIALLLLAVLLAICVLGLVSCVNTPDDTDVNQDGKDDKTDVTDKPKPEPEPEAKEYEVVWQNYNGDVLKTDKVKAGDIPVYGGAMPTKSGTSDVSYVFSGWTPAVSAVTDNVTYTAAFTERRNGDLTAGVDPIFSDDGKTVTYGFYPQTHVGDAELITQLNALIPSQTNGWYLYNGEYYAKETAKVFYSENYTFGDGTAIENGCEYWFKCEPIQWNVISDANGEYYLTSCKLLDVCAFYADYANRTADGKTVYANNYAQSDIRKWLNTDFFNSAFALGGEYVKQTDVNNGGASSVFACENTSDKVYLLSYSDCLNPDFGFDADADKTSPSRQCKTTDYARARGAWCNTKSGLEHNGTYWTRTASNKYNYCAWNVNSGGYLSEYAVDGTSHCVRPCITLSFVTNEK